ncbi:MAG: S8 family serine peptidase [Opitutales bacterium]|nr:S8 family serine peptidase [Opitutales bacterium]
MRNVLSACLLWFAVAGVPGFAEADGGRQPERAGASAAALRIQDILGEVQDLRDPADRARAVESIRARESALREEAHRRAAERGLPVRLEEPGGRVKEIFAFDAEDRPVYRETHNLNAAITAAADLLHNYPEAPLHGAGVTVGVWDAGSVRATHREFDDRVTLMNSASVNSHATHVAGTVAAAGVTSSARGMAPLARVDSYDWHDDKSEMAARAAASPDEAGTLFLSNHSYGYVAGWRFMGGGANPRFVWYGGESNAEETNFGAYNWAARDSDTLAYSAPYYLMFRSAGNDRTENPSDGDSVALSPGGATVTYDSSVHPAGDGLYRGGYDTISFDSVAKNVVTVGAVHDAVTGGARDLSKAAMAAFSSWGPTDDGRIKPDIVANGVTLYSTASGGDASYTTMSGTSMSAPSAAGSAALLVELYGTLFPGGAMRASTLKGLLIHTADDLANPGPDYRFGWGLINTAAAAALIRDFAENPLTRRITEDTLTTGDPEHRHEFVWDGESPVRATLSWTDPAGSATTAHDSRLPKLVNNLHLRIEGPEGEVFYPWVMPFVGTWTQASLSLPATTGVNNTDNVNQVYIAEPPSTGVYTAVVSYSGSLTNSHQTYSLLLTATANEEPPPPPLSITAVSPGNGPRGEVVYLGIEGTGFTADTAFTLRREGLSDIESSDVILATGGAYARFDLAGADTGLWDLVAARPDDDAVTAPEAFEIFRVLWSDYFDSGEVAGWLYENEPGDNAWFITDSLSQSLPTALYTPGVSQRSLTHLLSPAVDIPEDATGLQLRFWQRRAFNSNNHGGKLALSVDGGGWTDVAASVSGASFAQNGYNGTVSGGGPPNNRNPLTGQDAWVGSTAEFVETVVDLHDTSTFAGTTLRLRWSFGTNQGTSADGWWIDSVALFGEWAEPAPEPESATLGDLVVQYFPGADMETFDTGADHNLSGFPTLLDLAFGNDPATYGGSVHLPSTARDTAGVTLVYPLDRATEDIIRLFAEQSTDLSEWSPAVPGEDGITLDITEGGYRPASGEGNDTLSAVDRVEIFAPLDGDTPRFLRVSAELLEE